MLHACTRRLNGNTAQNAHATIAFKHPWVLHLDADEIGEHPFPRSETAVRALAELRGSEAGYAAAEAFMLLRDRG